MMILRILVLVSLVTLFGCRGGDASAPTPPAAENARIVLQEIVERGEVTSGAMLLRENLEELNQPGLISDLDALEAMRDPKQIKAKAHQMLSKLGAAAS